MNDLYYVEYEAKIMLVDCLDCDGPTELAHRRLCDLVWATDRPPRMADESLRTFCKCSPQDWQRVKGNLSFKGWKLQGEEMRHDGVEDLLAKSKAKHEARVNRARAGGLAKAALNHTPSTPEALPKQCSSNAQAVLDPCQSESESVLSVQAPPGFPLSENEAITQGDMVGVPKDVSALAYHKAVSRGFADAKGVIIRNFASHLKTEQAYANDRNNRDRRSQQNIRPDRNTGTLNAGKARAYAKAVRMAGA